MYTNDAGADALQQEKDFAGRQALITGGLGFIGSTLARRLVDLGTRVSIIDNLDPRYGGALFNIAGIENRLRVVADDILSADRVQELVSDCDFVFHLAGQSSHLDSMDDPFTDLEVNCRGVLNVLQACRDHPKIRVIFTSTRQVYGRPRYLPVDESHPLAPVDVNGVNKLAGEWYHNVFANAFDMSVAVLRLANTIGPRMRIKDARQTFLGSWIRQLLEGVPIEVWDGRQIRDFLYVDDAVDALLLAAVRPEAQGETFNIGGDESVTLLEVARTLVELNGAGRFSVTPFPADRKKIDIGHYSTDSSKARTHLGWRPRVSLREALTRTLSYFREHRQHYS